MIDEKDERCFNKVCALSRFQLHRVSPELCAEHPAMRSFGERYVPWSLCRGRAAGGGFAAVTNVLECKYDRPLAEDPCDDLSFLESP